MKKTIKKKVMDTQLRVVKVAQLSCATQGGKLITYGKNSQLTNVHAKMFFFCPENAKITKLTLLFIT